MAEPFLARMGVDWGPAITGTRQFIAQIEAELQKLNRLGPTERARAVATGQAAVATHVQGLVDTGTLTPREGERISQQALGPFAQYSQERNSALIEETASMRRAAAERNRMTALELEGDEAYIRARAETLATQRRIDAEVRAQAGRINGRGPGGGTGGGAAGLLGGFGSTILQGAAIGAGFRLASEVRNAVEEALALNQQLALLKDQADSIGQGAGFSLLSEQIRQTASETGVAASTIASLAQEFLGLYQNVGQAAIATDDAAKLIRVIGGDATQTGPAIAALAEDLGVSVQQIGNTVIDLQDKTGRSGKDMLVALGQLAPVAGELNLTLDQTRALIEAVGVGSAKTGQQIGEGLARVLPELQKNLPKLDQLGINISPAAAQGDTVAALKDLLGQYNQLSQAQQQLVISQLGGPRNAQILAAALRDPARAMAELNSQLTDNELLNRRASAAEDTLQGSTQKFHQSLVTLGDSIANSGVIQDLTDFINVLTKLVDVIGKVNGGLGGLPLQLGAGVGIYKVLSGLGGGAGAAEAGAGEGGLLSTLGLGALLGRGGAAATGGEAAGSWAVPVVAAFVAASTLYQGYKRNQASDKSWQNQTVQQFMPYSDQALQDVISGRNVPVVDLLTPGNGGVMTDRDVTDAAKKALTAHIADRMQNDVTALLAANVFSDDDLKAIKDDLAHTTDRKKVDDLAGRVQRASTSPEGAKALKDAAVERARKTAVVAASGDDNITTLADAAQAYQAGYIGYDQMVKIGKAEVASLGKFANDQTSVKNRLKDLVDLGKLAAQHIQQGVQERIAQLTATGQLSDANQLSIYTKMVADLRAAGADPQSILAAQQQQGTAQHKQFTDTISADQALRRARVVADPFGVADAAQQSAQDNLDILRQQGFGKDSPEYKDALAKKLEADQAVVDAQNQINAAQIDLLKAQDAADPLQAARDNQRAAALAVETAHGDAERLRAQAQQVQADQSVQKAIDDVANARLDLLKAVQTAGGDTVGAAQTSVQEAQQQINQAKTRGVPADSTEMIGLQRALVEAQAGEVSARIQSIETSVDQDLQLRTITVRQAVDRLKAAESIATSDTERKNIEIKIKQLIDSTGQNLAFDIPQNVQVPTLYQVRRFEAARGAGVGYSDNRNLNVTMYITNGMQQDQAKQFIGDLFGVSSSVVGASTRAY